MNVPEINELKIHDRLLFYADYEGKKHYIKADNLWVVTDVFKDYPVGLKTITLSNWQYSSPKVFELKNDKEGIFLINNGWHVDIKDIHLEGKFDSEKLSKYRSEAVNHPDHYGGKDNPHEAIKVIEAWGLNFCIGNAVKYLSRFGKKDKSKEIEDLKKAVWYIEREIKRRESENV